MSGKHQRNDAPGDAFVPPTAAERSEHTTGPAAEAQRLLVQLWQERQAICTSGRMPQRVVLSMHNYNVLQAYHALLGELPNPNIDYITRYTVFDLPVYIDNCSDCSVE